MRRLVALLVLAFAPACTCGKSSGELGQDAAAEASTAVDAGIVERSEDVERLWTDAKDGDEADLARLADKEGAVGLAERDNDPRYRLTALRAMAYTEGDVALPELGQAAQAGPEDESTAAVESACTLGARKRRQVDPEDAEELRVGCDRLLAAAKDATRPRAVRVGAVRALRSMVDRGCVNAGDIPADVDVK